MRVLMACRSHLATIPKENVLLLADPVSGITIWRTDQLERINSLEIPASKEGLRQRQIAIVNETEIASGSDEGVLLFDRRESAITDIIRIAEPGVWVQSVAVSCLLRSISDRTEIHPVLYLPRQAGHRLRTIRPS
jgi:hypothetical protein